MHVIPAVDLQDGVCVRLDQGNFSQAIAYSNNPLHQVKDFAAAGAEWVHVVDLDGARAGIMQQAPLIVRMAKESSVKVQAGGGIRDAVIVDQLLNAGVKRVVVGSLAVENSTLVKNWLKQFGPECVVLAFDVKLNEHNEPEVVIHGWLDKSHFSLWDILKIYADNGLKTVLCTDVSRDGMLAGSNIGLYATMRDRYPQLDILASGGIKDLGDLKALAGLGIKGAVVGKAIYEGRIDLAEANKALANAG